jgi:hypothetical protein
MRLAMKAVTPRRRCLIGSVEEATTPRPDLASLAPSDKLMTSILI